MSFQKMPPHNSCVASEAKGPYATFYEYLIRQVGGGGGGGGGGL